MHAFNALWDLFFYMSQVWQMWSSALRDKITVHIQCSALRYWFGEMTGVQEGYRETVWRRKFAWDLLGARVLPVSRQDLFHSNYTQVSDPDSQ